MFNVEVVEEGEFGLLHVLLQVFLHLVHQVGGDAAHQQVLLHKRGDRRVTDRKTNKHQMGKVHIISSLRKTSDHKGYVDSMVALIQKLRHS